MLKLVVVDVSADSRNRLVSRINTFLESEISGLEFIPRVNVQSLSREELRFCSAPDICLVGEEIVRTDPAEIESIHRALTGAALLVDTGRENDLATIEQLARLGADDVMNVETGPAEFLRKLVMLSRRFKSAKSGKLLAVESGKGGTGVTSAVAGLGELLAESGRKVALLDCDFQTQDLSRFLQTRPFINENLQLLYENQRQITQESVEQCLGRVWEESTLFCMPPCADLEHFYIPGTNCSRTFVSILEILDSLFDYVLVDTSSLRGGLLKALRRTADKIILMVSSDPAGLYAAVEQVARIREGLASVSDLLVVANNLTPGGLSSALLRREFSLASGLGPENWVDEALPFSRSAGRWPASGGTLLTCGGRKMKHALQAVLIRAGALEAGRNTNSRLLSMFTGRRPGRYGMLPAPEGAGAELLALPGSVQSGLILQNNGATTGFPDEEPRDAIPGADVW